MITLYGIPNCDQVKKARAWLQENEVPHEFHDFKKAGITEPMVRTWLETVSWDELLNRKGTTWRKLSDEQKNAVADERQAIALMLSQPSVIKRPVLCFGSAEEGNLKCEVGFSAEKYQNLFAGG